MHQSVSNADDLISLAQTSPEALNKASGSFLEYDKLQCLERTVNVATSLALVKSSRNELTPIHKPPAEIIGRIFQLAIPSNVPGFLRSDDFEAMKTDLRARIVISHVCVRWRAIALDMATFWSTVDMTSQPWALAGLERSKTTFIHVFARYPLHNTVAGSLLASRAPLVCGLSLEMPPQHQSIVPDELAMALPPLPNLECLCITTDRGEYDRIRPPIDLEHRPRIFPCPPLRLTKLILSNQCWFPGGIPLGQLTHLRITNGTPCKYLSLMAFLRQCVLLQELVLAYSPVTNIEDADDEDDELPVELPHLRFLTLGSTRRPWCGYLPLTFAFPPTLILRLFGLEEAGIQSLPQSLAFTKTLDTLVYQDASERNGIILQAAGPEPSCGLLIHAQDRCPPYTITSLRPLPKFLFALMGDLTNITRLTISSLLCDMALPLFPTIMPSVVFLRLVERVRLPVGLTWGNEYPLQNAFYASSYRFPNLVEIEVWSPRQFIPQLACVLKRLKRYTFYHIRGEKDGLNDPPPTVFCEDGVEFREYYAKQEPDIDLPGIRPAHGLSDW
ncbi:hypothetical protein GY45DRAFT_1437978 [Cubamyces sp. BRFM 1775]|nr:hypothetical protein GY45DRAFT_1437978 [Cubamyces sp. BRFM 1775]